MEKRAAEIKEENRLRREADADRVIGLLENLIDAKVSMHLSPSNLSLLRQEDIDAAKDALKAELLS